jgi:hypothetical protein
MLYKLDSLRIQFDSARAQPYGFVKPHGTLRILPSCCHLRDIGALGDELLKLYVRARIQNFHSCWFVCLSRSGINK